MEEKTVQIPCPKCQFPILTSFNFCPNCGKKFSDPPYSMTTLKAIGLIAFALLLPPLGFIPGIKYLFKKEKQAQIFGLVLIAVSFFATVAVLWTMTSIVGSQLAALQSQLDAANQMGL